MRQRVPDDDRVAGGITAISGRVRPIQNRIAPTPVIFLAMMIRARSPIWTTRALAPSRSP